MAGSCEHSNEALGSARLTEGLLASQEGLCSTELVF